MSPVFLGGESLNWFVRQHPQLFHDQSWFRSEPFAQKAIIGEFDEKNAPWPAAVYAAAFVQAAQDGHLLWGDHYTWTSDRDAEGHRVYIGRAAQYGGLQIHRKLTERIR